MAIVFSVLKGYWLKQTRKYTEHYLPKVYLTSYYTKVTTCLYKQTASKAKKALSNDRSWKN